MAGRPRGTVVLNLQEHEVLDGLSRRRGTPQGLAQRARIVLSCAEGLSNVQVAQQLGVSRDAVGKWRSRFLTAGLAGLHDGPRPGAPRRITDEQIQDVITRTLEKPIRQSDLLEAVDACLSGPSQP